MRVTTFVLALTLPLYLVSSSSAAVTEKFPPRHQQMVEFGPLLERLEKARKASISSVCGSSVAPWAYRGRSHAKKNSLRAYITDKADERWSNEFIRLLMREADWDSVFECKGSSRPCQDVHEFPLFLVDLDAAGSVYVLVDFERRCAKVFEPGHALGMVRFADRADSLFDLVRGAMRSDSLTQSLSLPAERHELDLSGVPLGYDPTLVERLPEAIRKVPPHYPEEARLAKVEGTVWIQALVDREGKVSDAVVVKSIEKLDDEALDAIWQWRFKPAASGDKPVSVWVAIPVKFSLR